MDTIKSFLPDFSPFEVVKIEKDNKNNQAHIYLEYPKKSMNIPQGYYLHSYYKRTIECLKLFEYRTFSLLEFLFIEAK